MHEHWFWWLITMACVLWYLTITIYVAVKGSFDIKAMFARLRQTRDAERAADDAQAAQTRRDA